MEIEIIEDLKPNQSYYSRSMNTDFTVFENNRVLQEIKFGFDGKLKTMSFGKFSKQYFGEGIIKN